MKDNDLVNELITMMNKWQYPVESPLEEGFITSINENNVKQDIHPILADLRSEVALLFNMQPTYLAFLRRMDGFEYNGLRLYSLSKAEPVATNLFIMNEFYRNNDDFVSPILAERLVIGDDSISLFTYDAKSNLFEIRDNIGIDNVFGSFNNFHDFLTEVMDTVR